MVAFAEGGDHGREKSTSCSPGRLCARPAGRRPGRSRCLPGRPHRRQHHTGCDLFTYPDCALRGAIIKANQHAGDDIVKLGAGTYTLSIAGIDEDLCQTGDLDVQDTLVIEGEGPERTFIDAAEIDRVLHMLAAGERLTVRGVTITGGNSGSQGGGGIFVVAGWPPARDCVVTGNVAPTGQGGGIYDTAYNTIFGVQVLDTWITGNTAHGCGGVHSTSQLFLEGSTVSSNTSPRWMRRLTCSEPTAGSTTPPSATTRRR